MTPNEAINHLQTHSTTNGSGMTTDKQHEEAKRIAIEALEQRMWIPVSERLPKPRIDVWCYSDMGQMVGYYEEHVKTWYGRDCLELMVTAWMPLPEPYKAESEDKE